MTLAAALIVIAALGWASAAVWWYLARRWQKLALDEAALVQKYAALLTRSIQTTDAALASRDELAMRSEQPSATSDTSLPIH